MSARNAPLPGPAGDGPGGSGQGPDTGREPASRPLSLLGIAGRPGAATGGADAEGGPLLTDGADVAGVAARAAPGGAGAGRARPRVNAHNLITLGVMLVSSGMVYGMRQYAMGAGIKYAKVDINYPLDGPVKSTGDDQRILADLRRSEVPLQVPADQLQKNPFMLNANAKVVAPTPGPKGPDRQEQLRTALGKLALRSVMDGKTPVARINDELVRVGDKVGGVFTVTGIHGRTVELSAEGAVFTLGMPDRPGPPGSPGGAGGSGASGAMPGAQGQPPMPARTTPRY
jgi:hypothetical protein